MGSGTCSGSESILFGWARDAPALQLPKGVFDVQISKCIFFVKGLITQHGWSNMSQNKVAQRNLHLNDDAIPVMKLGISKEIYPNPLMDLLWRYLIDASLPKCVYCCELFWHALKSTTAGFANFYDKATMVDWIHLNTSMNSYPP